MMAYKEKKSDSNKNCFLITPIGSKDSLEFKKLRALEDNVYKPILNKFYYELIIAHQIQETGSIGNQVIENILNADLVISNLTGLNANVMYETAVAHSFGIPTVMICEMTTKLPFDLISERTIFYDDSIEGCGQLVLDLEDRIDHLIKDGNFDNPVYRIIERSAVKNKVAGNEDEAAVTTKLLFELQDQVSNISKQVSSFSSTGIYDLQRDSAKRDYNAGNDVRYSAMIGKHGGIEVRNSNLFPKILIHELVRVTREMAEELDRMPVIEEIETRMGLSPNLKMNLVMNPKV